MTKPTSLAQGRVAHLIEWKGWPKPTDPPSNAHAHFSSYCHLTEGEKEARFAAGSSPPGLPGWLPHPPRSYLPGPARSRSLRVQSSAASPGSSSSVRRLISLKTLPCQRSAPPAAPSLRQLVVLAADGGLFHALLEHLAAHRRYKSSCCLAMTHPVSRH